MGALFDSPSTVSGAAWGTGQLHQENAKDLVELIFLIVLGKSLVIKSQA